MFPILFYGPRPLAGGLRDLSGCLDLDNNLLFLIPEYVLELQALGCVIVKFDILLVPFAPTPPVVNLVGHIIASDNRVLEGREACNNLDV